jgi:prokaryotic YEATS domain/PLD-like domain
MARSSLLKVRQSEEYQGNDWWSWSVWLEGSKPALEAVDFVEYTLPATFDNPVRVVRTPRNGFRLETEALDVFPIYIRVCRKDGSEISLKHQLKRRSPTNLKPSPKAKVTAPLAQRGSFILKAYAGDNKTLLAFNFSDPQSVRNLAGFTIQCTPPGGTPSYLLNDLQFKDPADHAQIGAEPPNSSVNAPIRKFRWIHIPRAQRGGTRPVSGVYQYTVTPRYFSGQSLEPIDRALSVSVTVAVGPFTKQGLTVGFTRGYTQSESFVRQFGPKASLRPHGKELLFDTSAVAGRTAEKWSFTYAEEYEWLGATARTAVFELLNEVLADPSLHLDVFAYDLNEPDIVNILLQLASQGRVRVILDDSALHHDSRSPTWADQFTVKFNKVARTPASILRGRFGRHAHQKALIVSKAAHPIKVLTGSADFSLNGLYVNANHVLVFRDPAVARRYSAVFDESWKCGASLSFRQSALAELPFNIQSSGTPQTTITFSPHTPRTATEILQAVSNRMREEEKSDNGSVFFSVVQLTGSSSPVTDTLTGLHNSKRIFSYGISDSPGGVWLYAPGKSGPGLVTGKPSQSRLPPPFDQVPISPGHAVHDQFVVCGFNGPNPVVYCGSSSLTLGAETSNGDSLIAIHDGATASCFAIEGLLLLDHYNFLYRYAEQRPQPDRDRKPALKKQPLSKRRAAISAGAFLSADDSWAHPYFDPRDFRFQERKLFG